MKQKINRPLCTQTVALALAATVWVTAAAGPLGAQTNVFPASGNVGIGTVSPQARLDIPGDSVRLSNFSGEREFLVQFPDGQANQKVDFYMAGSQVFWGSIDFDVVDAYSTQPAMGRMHKRFYLGINENSIWLNKSRIMDAEGQITDNYAISDLSYDAPNNRYKISLVHRVSTQNAPVVHLKALAQAAYMITNFLTFSAGPAYTTDTTVYPKQYINFNNNVGIGTTAPGAKLSVQGTGAEVWIQGDPANTLALGNWDGAWQYVRSVNVGTG